MRRRSLPALGAALLAAPALAQTSYPDRPIRFVVPFPAGGATDVWARLIAEAMSADLGQPIVIENRSGAGGMLGSDYVAKGPADGYTLLYTISPLIQSPVVFRRWPYQPLEDFAPIGKVGTTPLPFCIRPEIPAKTLAEFVAYARGRDLSFGSYATGSSGHAFAQLFSDVEKLNMTHIAYRGEAPMLTDILGGRIQCGFHSMTAAGDYIRSGRLRPLATLGKRRIPSMPDLPNFLELGYPDAFGMAGFIGLFAPVRVPPPILARLEASFAGAMRNEAVLRRLQDMDTLAGYLPPAEFKAEMAVQLRQWTELAESMNLSVDG
ncbi:tripartite tricarboxylate transporter substrate binding protein [Belnapia sp. T6]|uniref:Tripartite tricarboxylate transporter substrate binding protein n=1 Tax=Belnapia mucosa TaxID=2804532 RepID=A0ABS1V774_9PROT|nr:tripartite tricarboxylate transporter substrate binding protein [Belnapia mucosa]MBL6456173.1 tripartite tricarboxylate transporter substrate binding protein [Belnapia mucosa]